MSLAGFVARFVALAPQYRRIVQEHMAWGAAGGLALATVGMVLFVLRAIFQGGSPPLSYPLIAAPLVLLVAAIGGAVAGTESGEQAVRVKKRRDGLAAVIGQGEVTPRWPPLAGTGEPARRPGHEWEGRGP
jgi:hypothetical protein